MKKMILVLFLGLLSNSVFADDEVLLIDAACRVKCAQGETVRGQPPVTVSEAAGRMLYVNAVGMSREKIESEEYRDYLKSVCTTQLPKSKYVGHDCQYFKH